MASGSRLRDPRNLNTRTPRTLNLRLVAEPKRFDIGGKKIWGESYDGDYVGPTMHFVPGETVNLTLVNKLPTSTNLHFHGMHVSPSGHADNPYISVLPGKTFHYHFQIPVDQPIGTFWYHDHDMCMGDEKMVMSGMAMSGMAMSKDPAPHCQDIETQIYDGLSGTIIVGNDRTLLPSDLRHITTQTLAIKDMELTRSDHIVGHTENYSIVTPTVRLVDGQLRPVLTMRPGQTELWRIANEGADTFYKLELPGYTFTIVGQDGYPVTNVTSAKTLSLPPAKRWDVLVTASRHAGTTWLKTLPINDGVQGQKFFGGDLMKLKVAGAAKVAQPMPTGGLPTAIPSLANAPIARYRTVYLSQNSSGTEMFINGQQFNPKRSVFSTPAILGTVEEWTIYNVSEGVHVFHTHTDHFQVLSVNGVPQPYTGEQDVVDVPYMYPFNQHGVPGKVVVLIHFTDFTGKVMFHCHIASHEDAGMMSFVNVVKPPPGYNGSLIVPPAS